MYLRIVGRLAHIDMIIWMNHIFAAQLPTEDLNRSICNYLKIGMSDEEHEEGHEETVSTCLC